MNQNGDSVHWHRTGCATSAFLSGLPADRYSEWHPTRENEHCYGQLNRRDSTPGCCKSVVMARGADFESGNIIKKAKAMIPILVPLFISAFRRANELAMAMEARCYHGSEGRTKMKPLKYSRRDINAYLIIALYLACIIVVKVTLKLI